MRAGTKFAAALLASTTLAGAPAFASQAAIPQPVAGPHSMADLNTNYLNPALQSILSHNSGATSPTNGPGSAPMQYEMWMDTSTSPPTLRMYDGASWDAIGIINLSTHVFTPTNLPLPSILNSPSYTDGWVWTPVTAGANNLNFIFDDATYAGALASAGFGLVSNVSIPGSYDRTVAYINPGCSVCSSWAATTGDIDLTVIYGATSTAQGVGLVAGAVATFGPYSDASVNLGLAAVAFANIYSHVIEARDSTAAFVIIDSYTANQSAYLKFQNADVTNFQIGYSWNGSANEFTLGDQSRNVIDAIQNGGFSINSGGSITLNPLATYSVISTAHLTLPASTTSKSSLNIAQGVAPTSPVNGDVWITSAGLYYRFNSTTHGPL